MISLYEYQIKRGFKFNMFKRLKYVFFNNIYENVDTNKSNRIIFIL